MLRNSRYSLILNRPAEERRAAYYQLLSSLESIVGREVGPIAAFVDFMGRDQAAFGSFNVLSYIQNNFPYVHHAYESHRSTDDRKRQALDAIEEHWGAESRAEFADKSHDQVRVVAQIARRINMGLAYQQAQAIVRHRLENPGRGISTSAEIMTRDWQVIANQLTEAEVTAQPRAMELTSPYAPSSSSSQLPGRTRHQTPVSPTPQTGARSPFVSPSVMSSSPTASSSPTPQPAGRTEPRLRLREPRPVADAAQMGGAEPPAGAGPSRQTRTGKEVQTPNTPAARALVERLAQGCPCKNDVAWGPTDAWREGLHKAYKEQDREEAMLLLGALFYAYWEDQICDSHSAMLEEALGMRSCAEGKASRESLEAFWTNRKDLDRFRARFPDIFY